MILCNGLMVHSTFKPEEPFDKELSLQLQLPPELGTVAHDLPKKKWSMNNLKWREHDLTSLAIWGVIVIVVSTWSQVNFQTSLSITASIVTSGNSRMELRFSVSRSGPVWFLSLFWTRPGPDRSSEISFLGKNRTGLGKTGLHRSGLRYLSTLNQLRPRPVYIPSKRTQKY